MNYSCCQDCPQSLLDKRKYENGKHKEKCTTANYYRRLLKETMNEVDKCKYFQNCYLVIDNTPTYESSIIQEAIDVYVCLHTHQSQILLHNLGRLQKANLTLQQSSMMKVFEAS